MYWSGNRISLNITKAQAARGSHSGQCDRDIEELRKVPAIRRQLARLDPVEVVKEIAGYGAWNDEELSNHDANLNRLLWLACGDIKDGGN